MELLACHSERRVPGLATQIVRTGLGWLQQRGVQVRLPLLYCTVPYCTVLHCTVLQEVRVHASSHYSARVFLSNGFTAVYSHKFSDYRDPDTGEVVFPTQEPHTQASILVKRL